MEMRQVFNPCVEMRCAPDGTGIRRKRRPGAARWVAVMTLFLAHGSWCRAEEAQGREDAPVSTDTLLLDLPGLDDIDLPPPEDFLVDLPDEPPQRTPMGDADLARLRQAFAEVQEGNFEVAERLFREVLAVAPGEPMARLGLSTALLSLHAYEEAEALLQTLAEAYPEDHAVLNNLAWLYATSRELRFRDGERALRYARKALMQNPSSHHVWSTLAEAHFVRGAYAQAVRAAEQALHFAQAAEADESTIEERRRLLDRARQASRAFEILD